MTAKRLLTNLAIFLLSGFIIVYIIIQLISGLTKDVSFEYAMHQNLDTIIEKDCYLVRNETVLYATQSGVTTYSVSESQKVGSGQLIATVYSDERGVDIQNQISRIEEKIKILENSAIDTGFITSDISKIDSKINEYILQIRSAVTDQTLSLSTQYKDDLLINFNKRLLVTSRIERFDQQINSLLKEKANLTASLDHPLCSVYSQNPGYFSTLLDGYETVFTPNDIENLTVDSFHQLIQQEKDEYGNLAIGKLILDYEWRAVCEMTKDEASGFETGTSYPMTFLYSSGQSLNGTLERIVTQTDTDNVVLIFTIQKVPDDFDYTRCQTVKIKKSGTDGITFPTSALRIVNNELGVYVIEGNSVGFKKVDIIATTNTYYLSKVHTDTATENDYLSKYDRVITDGKDLYIGKLLG